MPSYAAQDRPKRHSGGYDSYDMGYKDGYGGYGDRSDSYGSYDSYGYSSYGGGGGGCHSCCHLGNNYNDLLIPLILAAAAGAAGFLGGYFFNNNNNGRRSLDTEAEAAQTVLQGTDIYTVPLFNPHL